MKKLCALLLALMLCLSAASALTSYYVPEDTTNMPQVPRLPDSPMIVRLQPGEGTMTLTLDRELPEESYLTFFAMDEEYKIITVDAAANDDGTYTAVLPEGAQWLEFEVTWLSSIGYAQSRFDAVGTLEYTVWYDEDWNEYYFDGEGQFYELAFDVSKVRVRFAPSGQRTSYGYEAFENTIVWFDNANNVIEATYRDDEYSAAWNPYDDWYIRTPTGRVNARVYLDPYAAAPLIAAAEDEEEDPDAEEVEVQWYSNNTINLAGIPLQEISTSLPDKWYNMIPVDLTVEGRRTYYLTITNVRFIGKCHVDVWDGEVTVYYSLMDSSDIQLTAEYGCWFTSLDQITAESIESTENGFVYGEPVSIEDDLGGADVALLFIRNNAHYRQPFKDGTEMVRYWRNKSSWQEFRQELQELLPALEN